MYVRLLSALSICDTCPAFLVIKSSYMPKHCGGSVRTRPSVVRAAFGRTDAVGIARRTGGSATASRCSDSSKNGYQESKEDRVDDDENRALMQSTRDGVSRNHGAG